MLKCFLWQPLKTGITNQWHQDFTAFLSENTRGQLSFSITSIWDWNTFYSHWNNLIQTYWCLLGFSNWEKNPKSPNPIKQYTLVKSNGGLFKILITQGLWPRPLAGVRYGAVWICSMADYQCLQQPQYLRTFSCNLHKIVQVFFLARI